MIRKGVVRWLAVAVLSISSACNKAAPQEPIEQLSNEPYYTAGNQRFGTSDEGAPRVIWTQPSHLATGVALLSPISVQFTEDMDPESIDLALGPPVDLGEPVWEAKSLVVFTPLQPFAPMSEYVLDISARDLSGSAMEPSRVAFTTGEPSSVLRVVAIQPADGAVDVPTTALLSITFSEPVQSSSAIIGTEPWNMLGNGPMLGRVWSLGHTRVEFPSAELWRPGVTYEVRIAAWADRRTLGTNEGGLQGATLVPLDPSSRFFTFTVAGSSGDVDPPTVLSNHPSKGARYVDVTTDIRVVFSEVMDRMSVERSIVSFPTVECSFSWDESGRELTCHPEALLEYQTEYTILVFGKDASGNDLDPFVHAIAFNTQTEAEAPPRVVSMTPADGDLVLTPSPPISLTFSKPMEPSSVESAFAILDPPGFGGGTFTWSADTKTVRYETAETLPTGETRLELLPAARSADGKTMTSTFSASYRIARESVVTLESILALEGVIDGQGIVELSEFSGPDMTIGISADGVIREGYLSFDLRALPADLVEIAEASFEMVQGETVGSPFDTYGPAWAHDVDYGSTLDSMDGAGRSTGTGSGGVGSGEPAPASNFSYFSDDPSPGPHSMDVTSRIVWRRASGVDLCQFKLAFRSWPVGTQVVADPPAPGIDHFVHFRSGAAAPAERPKLTLRVRHW